MTKEKIIEIVNACVQYNANQGTWSIDNRFADELLALFKQEKQEQAREILQNLKEYIAYETKPFIKWGSDNPQNEIPDACIDSDMLNNKIDEIAKEYGVEL